MRWLDRFTTLLKADAHNVLDQLEERSLLAQQHLREAQLELDRKRARCEALAEEARRLDEACARLRDEIAALDDDVALALAGDREELARFALRQLLPRRRSLAELARRRAEVSDERERLEARLARQRGELEELERRVRTQLASASDAPGATPSPPPPASDEEVELELLRRRAAGPGAAR